MRLQLPFGALLAAATLGIAHAQQPASRVVGIHTIGQQVPITHPDYAFANVYVLSNGGANVLAISSGDGLVLVDAKLAGWGKAALDAVQNVTDEPVLRIIHTNADEDHTGANTEYGDKVEVVMHEQAQSRFQKRAGTGAAALTFKPFKDRASFPIGKNHLHVYHFGKGHTDGDAVVVVPHGRLAFVGDLMNEKAVPIVDRANGGSALAWPETLARAVKELTGVERVITGHGPAPTGRGRPWPTWNDFKEYADFTRDFVDAAQAAFKNGRTVDQAVAELKLPERYKEYRLDGARAAIEAVYAELKDAKR